MYLFPFCENTKPTDPTRPVDDFKKGWQTVRTGANVKARFHDLRHTYVSRLAESGAPESVIRKIVGHIDETVLRRYTHTSRSAIQAAVSGLSLPGVVKEMAKVTAFPGV